MIDGIVLLEDHLNGMYVPTVRDEHIQLAGALLTDPDQFYETGLEMTRSWPIAARHNLEFLWSGRRAWVGQASCSYQASVTAATTRVAWGRLNAKEQRGANRVADQIIRAFHEGRINAETLPWD